MVNHVAMNCEHVWREISNYVDGELDADLRSSMDEHIQGCKRCASVLAGMRNVVQLYGDERILEVPAGFSGRLQKRLAKNAAVKRQRWSTWSAWLVPMAAIALFAGGLKLTNTFTFRRPVKSILAVPGRDIPPDMQVVVSNGSKVFHVAGCPFIHDKATERTITAKEAMRDGYVPCSRCLRQYLKTSVTHTPGEQVDDDATAESHEEEQETLNVAGH
jgi:hypothetical protein